MGRRSNLNKDGRNRTTRFARLDHSLLHSNAYRALSPNDRALLVELVSLENGDNNGSLYLSVRDGAHRMGVSDLTAASTSFRRLQELGFIQMTEDSHFHVKASEKSRARCWRLTWLAGPGRKGPTMDFLEIEPEAGSRDRKRMERGLKCLKRYKRAKDNGKFPELDSNTLSRFASISSSAAVLESKTPEVGNGGFPPIRRSRDSTTHTAAPWGARTANNLIGWWQPDWEPALAPWVAAISIVKLLPEHSAARTM